MEAKGKRHRPSYLSHSKHSSLRTSPTDRIIIYKNNTKIKHAQITTCPFFRENKVFSPLKPNS